MTRCSDNTQPEYFKGDQSKVVSSLGKETCLRILDEMLLVRNFETRAEQAYQQNKVWGFLHLYIGQEAIQAAAVHAIGAKENYYTTTYRCHALALYLGMTAKEGMCELYGKANGIAGGNGGSMHFFMDNMLGGHGIVGGQFGVATGAAFSLKYRNIKDQISVCFTGEGATAQGTFHESLNFSALWDLPYMCVVENNQWGMGTAADRALATHYIAENNSKAYGIKSYTVDGMDFVDMYAMFLDAKDYILKNQKPVLIESVGERFRGHSVSDPGLYRTKEELQEVMKRDPIHLFSEVLKAEKMITDDEYEARNEAKKSEVLEAMKFADKSDFPDPDGLETGVLVE